MQKLYTHFIIIAFSSCVASCSRMNDMHVKEKDGPRERMERDLEMMKDPALGYVPTDRLLKARQYKDELMAQQNIAIAGVDWRALGPKNQAGRTRAMLVDANDASGNTIWVGSVGGGLWKTTDITATEPAWSPVNDFFDNLAITSIAQAPLTPATMYFATGEQGYYNADAIRGLGVWKSTNSGTTWAQLASTNNSTFYHCHKVVVNSSGIVLVATANNGLQRSADGGGTWTKVLGTGLGITGAASNQCYDVDIAANGDIYATLSGSIHRSTNGGVTFGAAQTLPVTGSRIELACAPSDANYAYAVIENSSVVAGIIRTTDQGATWTSVSEPNDADPGIPDTDFSRSQAWYDLTIAVDPLQRDVIYAGGIDLFKSFDGGGTWTQISHWYGGFGFTYVHADQHNIVFRPGSSSVAYFTNDGGIYRTANANAVAPTISDKGTNYVTAQFYACAMHPTAFTNYFLAGAQDNGSHQFQSGVLQNTVEVTGGDGAFTHIDQDEPQYQFTSYVYSDYYRSSNGGVSWTNVTTGGGSFINPTDYDDVNNRMYVANASNSYKVWTNPQTGNAFTTVTIAGFGGMVTAIKVSPNTSNRVFFGANGDVFRVDNANTGAATATNISTGLPAAYLNCIEVQNGDDNHLLAIYTNYGISHVWESTNGGSSWTAIDGNLPDMPVRWALFNPNNSDQAVIATELGVWSTDNLDGGSTNWGASNSGLANTRVDMLQVRSSDKLMIAATHGRGLFLSDAFTTPTAMFEADVLTAYRGVPINFTSTSYNATSWSWNFGDAGTSTAENPSHSYSSSGRFNVTLTINSGASSLTKNLYIHILPNRGTPYTPANGGNFETNTDDFGSMALTGSTNKWERGVPTNFLTTVNSPVNAWKTDLDADITPGSYTCAMMTPNYNFSAAGGYTLRFRRSMEVLFCNAPFAVQCQYTTNKGVTWTRLGVNADPLGVNWYNSGPAAGCPLETSIFADQYGWITNVSNSQTSYDVSFLSGNPNVAFRFVLSVTGGYAAGTYAADGFMVDDFEILGPFNLPLPVKITNFTATKKDDDILVNWKTSNEIDMSNYAVERSYDGSSFLGASTVAAKNGASNNYSYLDVDAMLNGGQAPYAYYRLKMTDRGGRIRYSETARVALNKQGPEISVGPYPFHDFVMIHSSEAITQVIVYDMGGKQVYQTSDIIGNRVFFKNKLAGGMYLFRIFTRTGSVTRKMQKF
jgi:PKD repeat protein